MSGCHFVGWLRLSFPARGLDYHRSAEVFVLLILVGRLLILSVGGECRLPKTFRRCYIIDGKRGDGEERLGKHRVRRQTLRLGVAVRMRDDIEDLSKVLKLVGPRS